MHDRPQDPIHEATWSSCLQQYWLVAQFCPTIYFFHFPSYSFHFLDWKWKCWTERKKNCGGECKTKIGKWCEQKLARDSLSNSGSISHQEVLDWPCGHPCQQTECWFWCCSFSSLMVLALHLLKIFFKCHMDSFHLFFHLFRKARNIIRTVVTLVGYPFGATYQNTIKSNPIGIFGLNKLTSIQLWTWSI